ncbi:hypothetical protein [Sanguibacter massiliensis]|uniref:hypothetical protein n=1 Tax=Sanguibacter massiliensis TaxID=1973217 RepID=UPI000C844AEC|nr:hypothetical protein [Sanguibacter massiliensis]
MRLRSFAAVAAAAALVLAPAVPAQAKIVSACTVPINVPTRLSITEGRQPVGITSPGGLTCFETVMVEFDLIGGGGALGMFSIQPEQLGYQKGVVDYAGPDRGFAWRNNVTGTYAINVWKATLDSSWASRNGYSTTSDHANVVLSTSTIDVRYGARTSLTTTRTTAGLRLTGAVTRYSLYQGEPEWVAQPRTTVTAQKLVNGRWTNVATAATTSKGTYAFTVKDSTRGSWRVVSAATPGVWSATSTTRTAKSATVTTAKVSAVKANRKGSKATVTGKVTTNAGSGHLATSGVRVKLQARSGKAWKTVATVRSGSKGSLRATVKAPGTRSYRWVVVGTKAYRSGISGTARA